MPISSRYIADAVPQFRSQAAGFRPGTPPQPPSFSNSIINTAVPGASSLTQSASSIVGNLLKGLPGTSMARRANAYFGNASGMPNSDFVRNRGFDLYNQQGDQRQQQGIQDLLSLIAGTTSPLLQQNSQEQQNAQFNQNLAENQRQFDLDYAERRSQFNRLNPKRIFEKRLIPMTGGGLSPIGRGVGPEEVLWRQEYQ